MCNSHSYFDKPEYALSLSRLLRPSLEHLHASITISLGNAIRERREFRIVRTTLSRLLFVSPV